MKTIYINSFSRSGSTLLGAFLNDHLRSIYVGELRNYEKLYKNQITCYCGETIEKCGFWVKILNTHPTIGKSTNKHRFSTRSVYLLNYLSKSPSFTLKVIKAFFPKKYSESETSSKLFQILTTINEYYNPMYLIDSSKHNSNMIMMSGFLQRNLHIIQLVRDGRAVVASLKRQRGIPIEKGAKMWKNFYSTSNTQLKILKKNSNIINLKYEDFAKNPYHLFEKLEFLNLKNDLIDSSTEQLDVSLKNKHFIGGSPSLRKYNKEGTVKISLDERWRTELTEKELLTFERVAGKMNSNFGYH